MRWVFLLAATFTLACAAPRGRNVPVASGASVVDIDRGPSGADSPRTGTPAGSPPTIGATELSTAGAPR